MEMVKRDVSPGNRDDGFVEHEEESGVAVEGERRARFPDNNAKAEQLVSLCEMCRKIEFDHTCDPKTLAHGGQYSIPEIPPHALAC